MRARRRPWPLQNYPEGDREVVHRRGSSAVAMEAGTHLIWISAQLQELGHEVIVANVPRAK